MLASCFLLCSEGQAHQWNEPNEVKWRASIEADLRNGAPKETICANSLSSAQVSNDVPFKDWAYGIARKHCSEPFKFTKPIGAPSPYSGSSPSTERPDCPLLSAADVRRVASGERVKLMGGGCVMTFN
jgi:hypothetical protein